MTWDRFWDRFWYKNVYRIASLDADGAADSAPVGHVGVLQADLPAADEVEEVAEGARLVEHGHQ